MRANNCDASSICTNNPGSDTQLNNCTRLSTCLNSDFASLNTQNNNCSDGSFCANNGIIGAKEPSEQLLF